MNSRPGHFRTTFVIVAALWAGIVAPCYLQAAEVKSSVEWKKVSESAELTIYSRPQPGSALQELKAIGVIATPPSVVKKVLDDCAEFPHFLPYVVEAREISHGKSTRVTYQRISPPLVEDRDYTVRVHYDTAGAVIRSHWEAANDLGPAEKAGVVRVKSTQGSWVLEPSAGGRETLATYRILSDGGGGLPSFVTNWATRNGLPKLFDAIRKQARLARYH